MWGCHSAHYILDLKQFAQWCFPKKNMYKNLIKPYHLHKIDSFVCKNNFSGKCVKWKFNSKLSTQDISNK